MPDLRLIAAGIALATLIALGWWLHHSGYESGQEDARSAMQGALIEANARAAAKEQAAAYRVKTQEATHETQLADLDRRYRDAVARAGRVQVCPSGSRELPKAASNPGKHPQDPDERGPASADGVDIAPDLLLYGRDAEQLRLAVAACKAYGLEIERFRERP